MPKKIFEKTSDDIGGAEPESSVEDKNARLKNQAQLEIKNKIEKEIAHSSRADCVQRIKAEVAPFLGDKQEELFRALDEASAIQNDEKFVATVSGLLRPLVDMKIDDPKRYESARRQAILNRNDYVKVNDLFAYGMGESGDYIHLHVFPTQERKDKLGLLKEGMRKLAADVKANKNIKFVSATSWIVASNPRLLEMLGFDVEGPIDEETRKKHFADDTRPISKAVISREKLLEKYL